MPETTQSRWYRQPLLHFLLIGGVFFALRPSGRPDGQGAGEAVVDRSIQVNSESLDRLRKQYQLLQGRPPGQAELQGLVNGLVREEVLYREALSLGMDKDDTIVRRRMVQKMEFMAMGLSGDAEPTEKALQAWFDRDPERYRLPESLSFTHVYFSKDRRRGQAREQAEGVLLLLAAQAAVQPRAPEPGKPYPAGPDLPVRSQAEIEGPSRLLRARELGDPFPAGYDFTASAPADVERVFGKSFAQEVFRLEAGAWRGPVESSYGQHLVWVQERLGSRLPSLKEVRLEVRRDWIARGRTGAKDELYQQLRGKYSVVVDDPALQQGLDQAAAPAQAGGP